jgi:hypothetical protein
MCKITWLTHILIPELRRLRQEDLVFESSLDYIVKVCLYTHTHTHTHTCVQCFMKD